MIRRPPRTTPSPSAANSRTKAEAANVAGVTISGTATGADGQIATITIVDGSNVVKDTYTPTVTGGTWTITVTTAQAQALADGSYTVKANVSDAAGNPATQATQAIMV